MQKYLKSGGISKIKKGILEIDFTHGRKEKKFFVQNINQKNTLPIQKIVDFGNSIFLKSKCTNLPRFMYSIENFFQ